MERLTGLDASFLYLETPEQLLHVCGLVVLDPATIPDGYRFESLRDRIAERVRDIPMFTRKLKTVPFGLDHPVWVDDADFDVKRHIHRLAVPAPGGEAELSELCGHLASMPIDRSRPLWEMWVIEGLESGHVGVLMKMHHASVDGVNGANMLSHLCSLEADQPPLDLAPTGTRPGGAPSDTNLMARAIASQFAKPLEVVKLIGPTWALVGKTLSRARRGTAMAAPLTAPRTSFNGTITGHRSIAFTDISLSRIRDIKNAVEGATVNDVVLTVSGGALRRYLEERGELPVHSLLASVPVSVHEKTANDRGANKVSALFSRLGTDVADPLERLARMAVDNANAKEHQKAIPADTLQEWAEFAAPRTFGLAVRAVSSLGLADHGPVIHNLVISNVPGPPMPLFFMGARILGLYPLGPVFHGAGLNITVMSNMDTMHVGVIACESAMPNPWALAEKFDEELQALYDATVPAAT